MLVPNPYWTGPKPRFARITVRAIENTAALEANLLSGTIDMVAGETGLPLDEAIAFDKRHGSSFNIVYKPGLTFEHVDANLDNPTLADRRVREALLTGLDREAISRSLFGGRQAVADSFVEPLDAGFTDAVPHHPFDPAKAQQLLEDAGWKAQADGSRRNAEGKTLSLELMTTAGNRSRELVEQVLQSQWKKIGVDIRIKNEPARVMFGETVPHRRFELAMYAWISAPENAPRSIFRSDEVPTAANSYAGQNAPGYKSAEMDRIIDALEIELDKEKRKVLWAEAQSLYATDLPSLPLYFRSDTYILPKWLTGLRPTGNQYPHQPVGHRLGRDALRGLRRSTPLAHWGEREGSASQAREGEVGILGRLWNPPPHPGPLRPQGQRWERSSSRVIRFTAIRLVEIAAMLALMSFVIYGLIGLMPGDPIDLMMGADPHLSSADVARLKSLYGVDQPLLYRYWAWAQAALVGDLGYSRLFSAPVTATLLPRLGNSLILMGASFVLAFALALGLGIAAARRPRSWLDRAVNFACFAGISLPTFWLALIVILVFAAGLGWLPASGIATAGDGGLADRLRHLALPVAVLTVASLGGYTRYVRAAMQDALAQDHIRTARAKGASEARVIWHHALRSALVPIATILALSFGSLVSGALVTEEMFAYPGMGKLIFDAVMGNDYNLALAALLLATAVTMAANFAADLAYACLDPRVSYR